MNKYMENAKMNYLTALAVKNDLWVKNTGPWINEDGNEVPNRWTECDRADPKAVPDLNSAAILDIETQD